ncbi:unnamed protein product, partial [Prorocentrum cordatum]
MAGGPGGGSSARYYGRGPVGSRSRDRADRGRPGAPWWTVRACGLGPSTCLGAACTEPGTAVTTTHWSYVGDGRGAYEKVQTYNFVGEGEGAFEKDQAVEEDAGPRSPAACCCLCCLSAALAVLMVALVVAWLRGAGPAFVGDFVGFAPPGGLGLGRARAGADDAPVLSGSSGRWVHVAAVVQNLDYARLLGDHAALEAFEDAITRQ